MRRFRFASAFLLASTAICAAQVPPAPPPAPLPAAAGADPVVAKVDGSEIHASDLNEAAQTLPEELRGMPAPMLYPMLLDQLIDRRIIVIAAKKQGLDKQPAVQKQIDRATDSALQNALLSRDIAPTLTDDAIKTRYDRDFAGKAGEEEVHARHILVPDEEQAKTIITQLKAGGDFAELAKQFSKDPGAASGGDLGFFKKTDMLPEFADAAFALKLGEYTQAPVKTRFGWHVIKLEERRAAPPATLEQVRDQIRQGLIQEGVTKVLTAAKESVAVEKFKADGSPMDPADAAPAKAMPMPTPAPAK